MTAPTPLRALVVGSLAALSLAAVPAVSVAPSPDARVLDELRYERLNVVTDTLVELDEPLDHGPPVPEDSVGIGPGSTLIVNFHDPEQDATFTGICTAAFIFRDVATSKVYLGAAGHCFMGESFTSTHGPDADWDPANTLRVRVCVELCLGGATGLFSAAFGVYPGATRDIGVGDVKLDYARQNIDGAGVGNDFGIVEIPEELWPEIRTDMPVWNGPGTADTSRTVQAGDPIVHYGNGIAFGELIPTKGRAGIGVTSDDRRWIANLAASPGDSGSAVNIATVDADDLVEGDVAAGILTHLVIGTSGGVVAGTNTARGIEMARQDAGFELEVVHDPSQLEPGDDPDPSDGPEADIVAPSRVRAGEVATFDGSGSQGDITSWEWDMGDGTTLEGETVEHAYDRPGRRTVVLTVTDDAGATATATHAISVQGPPADR